MSYNEPEDLQNKYKGIGEQYTDNELQDILDTAHRKLDRRVGRKVRERRRPRFEDQEKFLISFSELISFNNITLNGDKIDDSNYTVDTKKGTVTFNTDYAEDEIEKTSELIFEYVPSRYKDLEVWYAVKDITLTNTLQTRNGESKIDTESAKKHIKEIENEVKSVAGNALVLDHVPRFHPHRNVF